MTTRQRAVGVGLGVLAPEAIGEISRTAENLGFDEVWVGEDYFFTGGVAAASAALAATEAIPVGIGIVSAMVRHPAVLAMEIATLARIHPHRVWPGIGLGVPGWLEQMSLLPRSQLGAMRECVTSVRRLLEGETLTETGANFAFDNVKLTYPPAEAVPLFMGVLAPKMLALSGEIADGNVGSVLAGTTYIRWARERIAEGVAASGRSARDRRFTVFALYSVDHDAKTAKAALRGLVAFYLSAVPKSALTDVYGIGDELSELAAGGAERLNAKMPDQWLEDLVVAGTPDECAAKIRALHDAGADSVVLWPVPSERAAELIELTAREVLPRLR